MAITLRIILASGSRIPDNGGDIFWKILVISMANHGPVERGAAYPGPHGQPGRASQQGSCDAARVTFRGHVQRGATVALKFCAQSHQR